MGGWLSHLELSWALPAERGFLEAMASGRTLLRYDRPGCGLSDPTAREFSLDLELETVAAVLAAAGVSRADVVASSLGVPVAIEWAARNPDTVDRMILYGGWACGPDLAQPAVREHVLGLIRGHWGLGADLITEIFAPDSSPGTRAALAGYQRRNFTVARAAAEAFLGELDPVKVGEVAAHVAVPGRFEVVDSQLVLDGAHNAAGMEALAATLPGFLGDRPLVAVVSILEDKDAAAMLRVLLPLCAQIVFCRINNPRALSPATLASLANQLGGVPGGGVHTERNVHDGVELARELAGPEGVVLATGSIYLLADLLRPRGAQPGATL